MSYLISSTSQFKYIEQDFLKSTVVNAQVIYFRTGPKRELLIRLMMCQFRLKMIAWR